MKEREESFGIWDDIPRPILNTVISGVVKVGGLILEKEVEDTPLKIPKNEGGTS